MFKINKKTEYALIALRHIMQKEAGEMTSAKEICEIYSTPFDATSRVLQVLANHSWLVSVQGAHGGYKMGEDLHSLSMKDLCEIIEGPQAIVKCLNSQKPSKCDLVRTCNMISPLQNLNSLLISFLEGVSVFELIVDPKIKNTFHMTQEKMRSLEGES